MQKYQSHKIVEAGKITKFEPGPDRYHVTVEGSPEVIGLTSEVGLRIVQMMADSIGNADFAPSAGDDLGYLLDYLDEGNNWVSWSPSEVFEGGYDLVQPSSGKSKIAGYRELNESEIFNMNVVKTWGKEMGDVIELMRNNPDHDQRWISVGATDLQKGLMALTRAIAKPEFF